MTTNKYFNIYANCIPVNGYLRSIIYDIQRNMPHFVPNAMLSFINKINKRDLFNSQIIKYLTIAENSSYLSFLLEHELAFNTEIADKNLFPEIDLNFETPELLFKIDVVLNNKLNIVFLSEIVEKFNLSIINIRLTFIKDEKLLDQFLERIKYSSLRNINLFFNDMIFNDGMLKYFEQEKRINLIYLTSTIEHNHVFNENKNKIFFFNTFKNKSIINQNSFIIETDIFLESQNFNTFYNKSLYIDEKNNISNTPLFNTVFGNLNQLKSTDNLIKIIETNEFQKYWYVNKASLDVCKICEFRHMCIDSRIPVQRNEKEWFFETECNYNPFIAKWKDEKGYKSLNECGIKSDSDGFKINDRQINKINDELWD